MTDTPVLAGVMVNGAVFELDVPVPFRMTDCGEFDAVPLTVKVAVSAPTMLGLKTTLIWQLAPAPRLVGQLLPLPLTKSAALAPLTRMFEMASTEVEEALVRVTVCGALAVPFRVSGKITGDGASSINPDPAMPLPTSGTVCVFGLASSVRTRSATRLFSAVGVKTTPITQLAPTTSWLPQVLVRMLKSVALVPVIAMPCDREVQRARPRVLQGHRNRAGGDIEGLAGEREGDAGGRQGHHRKGPGSAQCDGANGVAASLAMFKFAVWMPVAVGVKVTLIVQLPDAGTMVPQRLLTAELAGRGTTGRHRRDVHRKVAAVGTASRTCGSALGEVGASQVERQRTDRRDRSAGAAQLHGHGNRGAVAGDGQRAVSTPEDNGVNVTPIDARGAHGYGQVAQLLPFESATTWKLPVMTGALTVSG